ncbi:MAG: hypothetical protein DSY55_04275 [Clostridia bacterium]|nr:MAG: hypothetical protein DSY55_04275 [Clostridia bacterium]
MNAPFNANRPETAKLWQKLLRMLSLTRERELTCEETQTLLDHYVDLELAGEKPQELMPDVAQHLRICPECKEEHDALLKILEIDE